MKSLVFDTSTIINIIQIKHDEAITVFKGQNLLDLSYYELGNVLWKLLYRSLLDKDEINKVRETIESIWSIFNVLKSTIEDFKKILDIAIENELTFYDASFVYHAQKNDLTLVSDDGKMVKIGKKYGGVITSNEVTITNENKDDN